jgi:NhaA family Na+:H+ antiporter
MSTHPAPKGVFSVLPEILLISATVAALLWRNSGAGDVYVDILSFKAGLSLHHWVNDFLMVFFFFFIGLEVKKELKIGHLSTRQKLMLPMAGAVGGMLFPAMIFVGFAMSLSEPVMDLSGAQIDPLRGWAIPAATDIAFALGVLRIVGRGLPASLRVFLSALAIADDLGAIIIIAIFYSAGVSVPLLLGAAALLAVNSWLARTDRLKVPVLVVIGLLVWVAVLNSGVHATVAGVALALTVPASHDKHSLMVRLEHGLKPYIDLLIVPIFALCNAGIPLGDFSVNQLFAPITLGVALGLFIGKQVGVWIGAHIPIWFFKDATLPAGSTPMQFYGVCLLTGIGFTMSLFIAALAYPDGSAFSVQAKIGVLLGSLLSTVFGVVVLSLAPKNAKH